MFPGFLVLPDEVALNDCLTFLADEEHVAEEELAKKQEA